MRALNHKRSSYHCLRKPLIILCYTPHHAQELLATIRGIDDDGITEIISQPCGPRKLTKALERCNTQQSIYAKRPKCVDSERLLSELVPSPEFDAVGIRGNQCPTNGGPLPVSSKPKNRDNGHMIQKPMLDSLEMYAPGAPPGVSQVVDASRAPCDLETSTQSVLIVDDNSINLKLLVTFMKKQNCHYATTVNGLEALESFKANPGKFRIILMDITMPVMDGLTATREIRHLEKLYLSNLDTSAKASWRPATIVAVTGLGSASIQQDALSSGIDLFLAKPVRLHELREILQSCS